MSSAVISLSPKNEILCYKPLMDSTENEEETHQIPQKCSVSLNSPPTILLFISASAIEYG